MIKCLIVDDEPLAHRIIERFLSELSDMQLIAKCNNAVEAFEALNNSEIDLMFLDINMPKISGLNFLRNLKNPPKVIFTTAYREYAAEGFDLDVVDYLVKPFSQERFLKAVQKAREQLSAKQNITGTEIQNTENEYFFVKSDKRFYNIKFTDIIYFESVGDYVKVFTDTQSLITHTTIKNLIVQLPEKIFLQIHKSFIVNKQKIEFIEGNQIKAGGQFLPVGQVYKDNLQKLL